MIRSNHLNIDVDAGCLQSPVNVMHDQWSLIELIPKAAFPKVHSENHALCLFCCFLPFLELFSLISPVTMASEVFMTSLVIMEVCSQQIFSPNSCKPVVFLCVILSFYFIIATDIALSDIRHLFCSLFATFW